MAKNIECKLEHFGIRVSNLESSIRFYELNFGFQKIKEANKPDLQLRLATLQLKDFYLELLQPYTSEAKNKKAPTRNLSEILRETFSHIAISVNDLPSTYNKLTENNVEFATEFNPSISKNIFCYDPDGFLIELKQR